MTVRASMLGPALISAVVALSTGDPSHLMSLPPDEIACLEREPVPVRPLPFKARACIALDGEPGSECRPDLPLPLPASSSIGAFRMLSAIAAERPIPPRFVEVEPPEPIGSPRDGWERALDEPPRRV